MSLDRRSFLASAAAMAIPVVAESRAPVVTVSVDQPIGRISPLIYGQFAEHIGRLIYGGVWVGKESKTPNQDGFRLDTLRALERVKPPVFRWPGGCFADAYHWEDGVGPAEHRKSQRNHWWLRDEPNTFGTDEFLRWCELLDAEPYLSINVGTGSVAEAIHWIEYCNAAGDSAYATLRTQNGRPKPYSVRWWGVGNENWGCGGLMTAAEYAQQFRQYAVYLKRLGLTTDLELVGVGHTADIWNHHFLEAAGPSLPYLDHLSVHRYFRRGDSTTFSDSDYTNLMLDVSDFENTIRDAIRDMEAVEPIRAKMPVFGPLKPKPIGLVIDEWGVWHGDAKLEDGFRQNGVIREALFAASCLNLFHRYCTRISMTNIAQVINCLHSLVLAESDAIVLTPTYHVYDLFRPHRGATALSVDLSGSPILGNGVRSQPALSVSASRSQETVLITIVNQDPNDEIDLRIQLRGADPVHATATILAGQGVRAQNTVDNPTAVAPKAWKVSISIGGAIQLRLAAASVVAATVRIQ